MISLAELQNKARRQYERVLRAHLAGEDLFPLALPVNKTLDRTQGPAHIHAQQAELLHHSKNRTGRGYTLTLKPNAQTGQSEISRIAFDTQDEFFDFLDKSAEFARFVGGVARVEAALPELLPLLNQAPKLVLEQLDNWDDLLVVCQYFKQHPQPRQHVRNLPLPLPTKFIERNQAILRVLLNYLIPTHVRAEEENFFRRFHLYIEEPSIKIRFLDKALRLHPAVSQMSVWVSEFRQLNLPGHRVYVIENLTTFLSFPLVENGLAIWGGGFAVSLLAGAAWLAQKQLFYWGDIDIHGFQILAQIRGHYPAMQSLLMDYDTFSRYYQNGQGGNFTAHPLAHLTLAEAQLYQSLLLTNARLEQEQLPLHYVESVIRQMAVV